MGFCRILKPRKRYALTGYILGCDCHYSTIGRGKKLDRDVASMPLAERRSCDENGGICLKSLRAELDSLEYGDVHGNSAVYGALLQKCVAAKALLEGKRLHAFITKSGFDEDTFVGNHLVQMYGCCGRLQDAFLVFEGIRHPNVISWNIMLAAYAQNGHLQDAKSTFYRMPRRDVVSWTAMITAYAQNGQASEALQLFRAMDLEGTQPNKITFLSILDACAAMGLLAEGREIHVNIVLSGIQQDVKIGTALVNMYGKCGNLTDARITFDNMPERNVISWNAMVAAYAQNGHLEEAKAVFDSMPTPNVSSWNAIITGYAQIGHIAQAFRHLQFMDLHGFQPNTITFVSILDVCANVTALAEGKLVHASIDIGFHLDVPVTTALLYMYGKCGNLQVARRLFEELPERNVVSWTAMIAAYAQNGHGDDALELFQLMTLEGGTPNEITFSSILCACSHAGLLDHAHGYFVTMNANYGITTRLEHYVCMIDLLGRVGWLKEAEELAHSMPFEPDNVTWTALLGACKLHGDMSRGSGAAGRVLQLKPQDSSAYVLLHNMYKGKGWAGINLF